EVRAQCSRHRFGGLLGGGDARLEVGGGAVDHGLEELPLAGKVLVKQRLRDARRGRDFARRGGVIAAGAEDRLGRVEDRLPTLGSRQALAGAFDEYRHISKRSLISYGDRPARSSGSVYSPSNAALA